ncbi:MAG TPA: hypothetical protein VHA75_14015 [Rugosimonospora sp.]|nr:hypothetical protein [Rugosimonospora sp.]
MFEHVRSTVSVERMAPYLAAADGDARQALRLYEWNSAVAASFHRLLEQLEIGLRNAVHRQMSLLMGLSTWWDKPGLVLANPCPAMIREARATVVRRGRTDIQPGDVVAALSFGFWVSMFSSGRSANYEMTLWRPGLRHALPGYTGTRADLYLRLRSLRLLRNRVAHHEPIFRRHLAADHASVVGLLGDISPEFAAWVTGFDEVPAVLARRP